MKALVSKQKPTEVTHEFYFDNFIEVFIQKDKPLVCEKNKKVLRRILNRKLTAKAAIRWYGVDLRKKELGQLLLRGWQNKMSEFKELIAEQTKISPAFRRQRKRCKSDAGHSLDIHAVNSGNIQRAWEDYRYTYSEESNRREVHIIYYVGYHRTEEMDEAKWGGIATCVLAQNLIQRGHRVQIDFVSVFGGAILQSKEKGRSLLITFPVKRLEDRLNMLHTVTMICLPATERWSVWIASIINCPAKIASGLGQSTKRIPSLFRKKEYIEVHGIFSKEEAQRFLNEQLNK